MKKNFIILLFIFFSLHLTAQGLDGCYKNKTDSLSFSGDKVTFSISGFGALFTQMVGEGTYQLFNDYLLINTVPYSGIKSTFVALERRKKDTITVQVVTPENYPIKGALTEFIAENGKNIKTSVSGDNGEIEQANTQKINKIKVSHLGLNDITFDIEAGRDYLVKLAKNNIIENQTVALKIENEDNDIISITLLSDNFNGGKDILKSLEKLNQKAQKKNVLSKRLKKEYIPVYYKR